MPRVQLEVFIFDASRTIQMKIFRLWLLLTPFPIWSQHSLEVQVTGITNAAGTIEVALFTSREGFLKHEAVYRAESAKALKGATYLLFENLPEGTYALAVFQDVNENRKLDTNWLGIPKEPTGFSHARMKTFGPPSFEDCHLVLREDTRISVTLE